MTYLANIDNPSVSSRFFARIRPRARVTAFTNVSGNTWQADFSLGPVAAIELNGEQLNYQSTIPLSSGTYSYNPTLGKVYVYATTNPSLSSQFVVVGYELYFSDFGTTLSRDPLDYTDTKVFWDGILANVPTFRQTSSDALFGFFPLEGSGLSVINADHSLDKHLYSSSFSEIELAIYHCVGELTEANTYNIFNGFIRGFSATSDRIDFTVENLYRGLDKTVDDQLYFDTITGYTIDPVATDANAPYAVRSIYGRVDGLIPINGNYSDTPSITNNRVWIVGRANISGEINQLIDTGGTNNSGLTTLIDASGIMIGDWIWLQDVATSVEVTAVDYTTKQVAHSAAGARSVAPGHTCKRYSVASVYIRLERSTVKLIPRVDYTVGYDGTNDVVYIDLVDNFEANTGGAIALFEPANMQIFCRAYGQIDIPMYSDNVTVVTTLNQRGLNPNNIGMFVYKFLSEAIGKDFIDEASVAAMISGNTDLVGFTVPSAPTDTEYPTYRELINKLFQSGLIRSFVGLDGNALKIKFSFIEPLGAAAGTVSESEIINFSYRVDYNNTFQRVQLAYQPKDIAVDAVQTFRPAFRVDFGDTFLVSNGSFTAQNIALKARYLDRITNQFQIETVLILADEAEDVADRLLYLLHERRATFTIGCKNSAVLAELGETYSLERQSLPGFDYVLGVQNTRDAVVVDTSKTLSGIELNLDDQKGVEDNAGSW